MPRSVQLCIALLALACVAPAELRTQPLPAGGSAALLLGRASPNATGTPFIQVWRPEDYDAAPANTALVQHPQSGCIFVGNSDGVLEFDGVRWRLIPLPKSDPVLALAVDLRGRVWAAGESEIVRLEPDAVGSFRAVTIVHPLPEGEDGHFESAVAADDGVWFGGLQHIVRIGPDDTVNTWETRERFGAIWVMDGAVHTIVSEREIVRLDPGGQLTLMLSRNISRVPPNRISPLRVFAARPGAGGDTVLLTAAGPFRWNGVTRQLRPLPVRPAQLREAEAITATFLPDGAMLFVAARPGGYLLSPEGALERVFERVPAVMNPRVSHLLADREGGVWVSTRDHLARMQLRSPFMRHEGGQGLQGTPRQLLRAHGKLLVAHSEGVSRHHPLPGNFPPIEGLRRGAEALVMVDDIVFAAAAGLLELPVHAGAAIPLSDQAITSVCGVHGTPATLIAGDAQGAWIFRREAGGWQALGRLAHLRTGVAALFDGRDGCTWGATTDGRLWRADFRDGVKLDAPVKLFGPNEGVPPPRQSRRISFFRLGAGLNATCAAWLLRHDAATDRFWPETRIAHVSGTHALGAEAIGQTADGACWLRMGAPDRRLLRVVPEGAERWGTNELPAPIIRDLAALSLCEDDRTLWVAGADLLVSIDLDFPARQPAAPLAARVRRVFLTSGEVVWGEGAKDPAAPLALASGEDSLRIEFAAPTFITDYRGRAIVQYRTQLEGLERGWSSWTLEAWRDFTRLPPGRYAFRVEATDQAGRVSPEARLAIVVTAPWWRTRWAWAGYAAVLGLVVLGGVRLRTRALRRRAARLEEMVAARTEELRRTNAELARLHRLELDEKAAARLAEEQARLEVLRYQLNPHFLYNALNSVYSLALTAPPAAASMVLKLADFCRVALDRRGEEHTTVGAEFDKLTNYLEIEKVRWGDTLHIAVEADAAARAARIPPFLLLPLVENAIKYGGATSPEELHVRVSARRRDGALEFEVANTGRWVERDDAAPAQGKSSGIGLTNLRQRLARCFPGAHQLAIEKENGWVVVKLKIAECGGRMEGPDKTAAAATATPPSAPRPPHS